MKKLIVICAMFALLGGGVGSLWFFKVPPFARAAKKPAAATAKHVKPSSAPTPAEEPKTEPKSDPVAAAASQTPNVAISDQATQPSQSPPADAQHTPPKSRIPALSEPDLNRMAAVYEQMPVDEATKIMAKLPDSVVEPLLRRMDEKQVGKLLATFPAERSAKLTLAMTGSGTSLAASP